MDAFLSDVGLSQPVILGCSIWFIATDKYAWAFMPFGVIFFIVTLYWVRWGLKRPERQWLSVELSRFMRSEWSHRSQMDLARSLKEETQEKIAAIDGRVTYES